LLEEMGIDQIAVENKEVNGKVEAFNGNLHKELLDKTTFDGVDDLHRGLKEHIWWYNHRRTHHALGGGLLCPADRFYKRTDEVEARIESGEVDGPIDLLEMAGRQLDLFRVTFREGRPEVWLMGERLYPAE
ncbi:MAG: integrase core domain-containing protein, partial [Bradymonadaceae bacterium]